MAKDPICGMEVDERKAKFMLVKDGKENYFCSKNCYNKFLEQGKEPILEKSIKTKPISGKTIISKKTKAIENNSTINSKTITSKKSGTEKIILPIKGMHCASCAITIEKSLKRIPGAKTANVNFASEKANIEYDFNKVDEEKLEDAVKDAGYEVIKTGGKAGTVTLRVRGMSSQHCAGVVESSLRKLDGIKNIYTSFSI